MTKPRMEVLPPQAFSCSVIVPCRNEKGNIEAAARRIPEMGCATEIIFVEGHSQDGTLEECLRVQREFRHRKIQVLTQDGAGKGDAVRKGFAHATHDVLMILDADLTVAPEDLPRFLDALTAGRGGLIVGSRFRFPMAKGAMPTLNFVGNRFFAVALRYLLGQPITDALCGTKVLRRLDYQRLGQVRDSFRKRDPFGDFDLLFGAAQLCLPIAEVPVHYVARSYGSTQIRRFRDGFMLFQMLLRALCVLRRSR